MESEKILNMIWAKSDGTSLAQHTADVIKGVLSSGSTLNPNILIAALFHDFGKIHPKFQIKLREMAKNMAESSNETSKTDSSERHITKNFQKESTSNRDKVREIFGNLFDSFPPYPKHYIRHEFLSLFYLAYFWPAIKDALPGLSLKKVANLIAWHHRNELTAPLNRPLVGFSDDLNTQDTTKMVFQNLFGPVPTEKALKEFYDWVNTKQNLFKNFFQEIQKELGQEVPGVLVSLLSNLSSTQGPGCDEFSENCANIFRELGYLPSLLEFSKNGEFEPSVQKAQKYLLPSGKLKRADYLASALEEEKPVQKENLAGLSSCQNAITSLPKSENKKQERWWQDEILSDFFDKSNRAEYDIFILEAPTGSGKTYFAYTLAEKLGVKRLLYVLPYRAALNEKYHKAVSQPQLKDCVGLIHSTSFLEFEKKQKKEGNGKRVNQEGDVNNAAIMKWILSKYFDFPILFSTADQTMLTALEFYPYDFYLILYENALIVLDEPQAYDTHQLAILLRTIQYAIAVGAKVLVMTATFPHSLKDQLQNMKKRICTFKVKGKGVEIEVNNGETPRSENVDVKNASVSRHKIHLEEVGKDVIKEIANRIKERLNNHSNMDKVLVVMNTVKSARELYEKLKEEIKDRETLLLHSRIGWDRKNEILQKMGAVKEKEQNKVLSKWLLVTTQVVEAAVDLDADLLFTVLSPIPSQVQRWGRVWRSRKNQDYDGEEANVIVFVPKASDWNSFRRLYWNVYGEEELKKSLEILKKSSDKEVLAYSQERDLVKKFYNEISSPDELERAFYDLPYFAAAIDSKKKAGKLFRPEDHTVQVVIKEEIMEKFGRIEWSDFRSAYFDLLKHSYTIPKNKLKKLGEDDKIRMDEAVISINKKERSQIGDIWIISVPDYDEKKDEIKEMGLEFL